MTETADAQREGRFDAMTDRDREIQASIWALLFLVSEISLAFRSLRDRLTARGALLEEDEQIINELASQEDSMKMVYTHIERAFREKYERVLIAMSDPERVAREMDAKYTTAASTRQGSPGAPAPGPGSTGGVVPVEEDFVPIEED